MLPHNLTHNVKTVRVINATAAGTSDVNGATVDMQGFEAVRFLVGFGTLTASQDERKSFPGQTTDETTLGNFFIDHQTHPD